MRPPRSLTSARPSGRNTSDQGTFRPDAHTDTVTPGGFGTIRSLTDCGSLPFRGAAPTTPAIAKQTIAARSGSAVSAECRVTFAPRLNDAWFVCGLPVWTDVRRDAVSLDRVATPREDNLRRSP